MVHLTLLLLLSGLLAAHVAADEVVQEAKIVGGIAAEISSFPYLVSLQISGSHFCGGSIYNSRYIVTAAHCIKAITTPTDIKIRYGSSYWASGGTLIGVSNAKIHPSYNASTKQYDIGVLKTSSSIVWGTNVKSVFLAEKEPANAAAARISGWGTMSSGATSIPSQLQSATVNIISRSNCQSSAYRYGTSVRSTMICAGASGIDSCQGDSGGPLMSGGAQVGIVSWGSGCAKALYPGVYSSVAQLKSFVTSTIGTL